MDDDDLLDENLSDDNQPLPEDAAAETESAQENNDDDEPQFELSPEDATNLDGKSGPKPVFLNRKKLLVAACAFLSATVLIAFFANTAKSSKKTEIADNEYSQREYSQQEFLDTLQRNAMRANAQKAREEEIAKALEEGREPDIEPEEPALPEITISEQRPFMPNPQSQQQLQPQPQQYQQPQNQMQNGGGGGGGGSSGSDRSNPNLSPIVAPVQGSLFAAGQNQQQQIPVSSPNAQPQTPQYNIPSFGAQQSNYSAQNNQDNKNEFYSPSNGGEVYSGQFIGENSIWMGTVIPGILETAINTDLPGNILARVTNNVFDSKTGRILLIPQGSLLLARYNSSVSYAQKRVQIIWDTLIRPDGFEISLGGAPGVDSEGMSGQAALYSENWFEYAKAAGIISMFTLANASLSAAAEIGGENSIAASNANLIGQLGGNITSRVLDIQPTLTVENGSQINILLNKTLFLPPATPAQVSQRYILN